MICCKMSGIMSSAAAIRDCKLNSIAMVTSELLVTCRGDCHDLLCLIDGWFG